MCVSFCLRVFVVLLICVFDWMCVFAFVFVACVLFVPVCCEHLCFRFVVSVCVVGSLLLLLVRVCFFLISAFA